jgi:predicted GNAT superfamily acetyltransferase
LADTPWQKAHAAANAAGVELRSLSSLSDADRIFAVMTATWGEHQLLPREMVRALAESGNVPWGAFDGDELVGYVLGWAGVEPEDAELHVHSHMLAAVPGRRSKGVGYALKLAQRAQALDQGIHLVRWTFDPLVSRNAWFNLGKLGAVADRFERDFYGEMSDSLNLGERSDRLVVRWDLDREGATPPSTGASVLERVGDPPRPVRPASPKHDGASVQIPREYAELKASEPDLAGEWRDATADAMEQCFAVGLIAAAFDGSTSTYAFAPVERV